MEKIKNAIMKQGYEVEVKEITKNGVKMTAFVVGEGTIRPAIYLDTVSEGLKQRGIEADSDSIASEIIAIYEAHKDASFDTNEMFSLDYFRKYARVCLQRSSAEAIVKKDSQFKNIEMYIRVIENDKSFKITPAYVKTLNITEDEAWDIALKNTLSDVKIFNIGCASMWVLTNSYKMQGAGSLLALDKELLAGKIDTDSVYVIPSSIHEVIIVPSNIGNIEEFSAMVREVNSCEVSEEERLADEVFEIRL